MPSTIIRTTPNDQSGVRGNRETFVGDVYLQGIFNSKDLKVNNVLFTPGSRTHWHTHEKGQIIKVLAGCGWICDRGGKPRLLREGDIVWADPGTEHWHGGDDNTYMCHLTISHGQTTWKGEVDQADFDSKNDEAKQQTLPAELL